MASHFNIARKKIIYCLPDRILNDIFSCDVKIFSVKSLLKKLRSLNRYSLSSYLIEVYLLELYF
jgi:hypothetical protein